MDLITFSLPRLARGCEHGGLSRTGKPDHRRDAFSPGNMLDRLTLFGRQSRRRIARGHHSARTSPKRAILPLHGALDMARIDTVGLRLMQPLRRSRHCEFQIYHVPRRIARIGDVARLRIDVLSLKFDKR